MKTLNHRIGRTSIEERNQDPSNKDLIHGLDHITTRAKAVLTMVQDQFVDPEADRLNDDIIYFALESIQKDFDDIGQIREALLAGGVK